MKSLLLILALLHPLVLGQHEYKSYQATPVCNPSGPIQSPENLADLRTLISDAHASSGTIKPLGSRHSSTDIICTDGFPFTMQNFNLTTYNTTDDTVTFGAGVKLQTALTFLQNLNRTFATIPQFRDITIAGSVATGAHGSSLKHPSSLSDQIVRMTILDGNGELKVIQDEPELNIFRVAIGLLGIVLDVTFATVPAYKLKMEVTPMNESIFFDGTLLTMAREYDVCLAQWFPQQEMVLVTTGTKVPMSTEGKAFQNLYPPSPVELTKFTVEFTEFIGSVRNLEAFYAIEEYSSLMYYQTLVGMLPYYTEDNVTFLNPATGLGWELTASNCIDQLNGCSWSNGNYSLQHDEEPVSCHVDETPEIVRTIKGILLQSPGAFVLSGIVFRFQQNSKAELYMAHGRDSVAVELIYPVRTPFDVNNPPMTTGTFQAIIQALVFKHGGRTHWGKNGMAWLTHSNILAQYPEETVNRFISTMEKYDPQGILRNKFSGRLTNTSDLMDVDPLERHCALRQNCICQIDSHCANDLINAQICGDLPDIDGVHVYKVCKDTKNYFNPPLGPYQPNNLTDIVRAVIESYQPPTTTPNTPNTTPNTSPNTPDTTPNTSDNTPNTPPVTQITTPNTTPATTPTTTPNTTPGPSSATHISRIQLEVFILVQIMIMKMISCRWIS